MRIRIRDPGSFTPWTRDAKNSDPGSGINIPDLQYRKTPQDKYKKDVNKYQITVKINTSL
jgi:hypothetical protein